MTLVTDQSAKKKTSKLYDLCSRLFGEEFNGKFTAPREVFRDWLNSKTGLNVDHIKNKHQALDAWILQLEAMKEDLDNAARIP